MTECKLAKKPFDLFGFGNDATSHTNLILKIHSQPLEKSINLHSLAISVLMFSARLDALYETEIMYTESV